MNFLRYFFKFSKKIHFQHAAHQHLTLYSLYCMIKIRQYRCQMIHRSCTKQRKRSCDHFVMSRDQKMSRSLLIHPKIKYDVFSWNLTGMDLRCASLHWNSFGWPWLIFKVIDPFLFRQTENRQKARQMDRRTEVTALPPVLTWSVTKEVSVTVPLWSNNI